LERLLRCDGLERVGFGRLLDRTSVERGREDGLEGERVGDLDGVGAGVGDSDGVGRDGVERDAEREDVEPALDVDHTATGPAPAPVNDVEEEHDAGQHASDDAEDWVDNDHPNDPYSEVGDADSDSRFVDVGVGEDVRDRGWEKLKDNIHPVLGSVPDSVDRRKITLADDESVPPEVGVYDVRMSLHLGRRYNHSKEAEDLGSPEGNNTLLLVGAA